jgi:LacI family transcriptional regulator, galactose operon repressor
VAERRVTLADVAERAGVSRTTASFVITGRRDMRISKEAVQRVLAAARELNYRPNLLARSLRTRVRHNVGFISDRITTEAFTGDMIRGGVAMAQKHGRLLFIGETQGDAAIELDVTHSMLDWGVAGFVYASMYTREVSLPAWLDGHPVVLLNCFSPHAAVSTVLPDERGAGGDAARVLLHHGHRDSIVLVGGTREVMQQGVFAARERLAGIEQALATAGTELLGFISSAWRPDLAFQAVSEFFAAGGRATALVCITDKVAFGAYQAIADAGLRVPEDISVVSFDDSDIAAWLRPGLTSIAIPHFEMGQLAVELLACEPAVAQMHQLPMPVHSRDSVGPSRRTLAGDGSR